jgi:hypothetical protein
MSTIVRAADAAQFLSVLPHLLGCTPRDSVVVVPLSQGRTLGVMRVDLPSETAAAGAAASIIGMACRIVDVEAVMLVVYTDAEISTEPSPVLPTAPSSTPSARAPTSAGCRSPRRSSSRRTAGDRHCRTVCRPGVTHWSDRAARGSAARGRGRPARGGPGGRGAAAVARRCAAPGGRAGAAVTGRGARDHLRHPADEWVRPVRIDPAALQAACALDDLPALFERALSWNPDDLAPMDAASIGWCLARAGLRDVALVQWATDVDGGDAAMEAQRRWEDGELYPSDLAEVMWGDGPRPDATRLDAALRLARNVAALMPKKRRAGALAVCGWIAWARGRSTHAEAYVRQALHADPRHGLAEIVGSFVAAGHLPDWAFRAR